MRYVMWSPLPPERSGIADYTYELLGSLATKVDIVAVGRNAGTAEVPPGVVLGTPPEPAGPGVLNVYHMGNHAGSHSWIHRQAMADPGIVVLHDTSLMDLWAARTGGIDSAAFQREVEYAHGPIRGDLGDPALINGWPAIEVDGVPTLDRSTLTLERRLLSTCRGVIVHDPYSAGWLRARYPRLPAFVVPSGASPRDDGDRTAARAGLGWRDDDVVFGVFGGIGRIKRVLVAVLAFTQVRRRWPQARLLIAGYADDADVLADIRRTVERLPPGSVRIELAPAKDEFERLIGATDVVVNLRWPTAGETSAVMMRAFGAGKAVITSDLPQHRHLDPAFCLKVPIDPAAEAAALTTLMERLVAEPDEARRAGRQAREHVRRFASWPVVAEGYRQALETVAVPRPGSPAGSRPPAGGSGLPGVNVFADLRATTGIAESARRHVAALAATGVELTFTEFNSRAPNRSVALPGAVAELRGGKEHPVDLWLVNLNEFHLIPDGALDRYTIAVWAWELPEIIDQTRVDVARVDELWVVSTFVAETFRTVTDKPVTVIPNVVPDLSGVRPDRARFNLPADGLVVLFTFSASSSHARKNPWGVIEAFRRAFPPTHLGHAAHLVIKAVDLDQFPELAGLLAEEVAGVHGTLITDELTRPDMDTLLATCDVYVSLHRSEGFGLGMAEAMALGKPVVATGYGGNLDFMPPGAAAVVGFDVRAITAADHRFSAESANWYQPGKLWAEPDVEQAARWLRRLADSAALRRSMGERAAEAIRSRCGQEAVGAAMRGRLAQLGAALAGHPAGR
jgi:glycosyltransferase involved in cell wall biosynthesis